VIIVSLLIAVVVAAPQLIAYSEIASEVERAQGYWRCIPRRHQQPAQTYENPQ